MIKKALCKKEEVWKTLVTCWLVDVVCGILVVTVGIIRANAKYRRALNESEIVEENGGQENE